MRRKVLRGPAPHPGGARCRAGDPHLQSGLQVGLEPLPVVRHRPRSPCPAERSGWTLGRSAIQVRPPAAGLRRLQDRRWASAPPEPRPGPGPVLPRALRPHRGLVATPGSATGARPWVPAAPRREATARGCEVPRRRPRPGPPSGRGTPGRALGVRSRVTGGRPAPSPPGSLPAAPSARSPRVSSGAASTSSCGGSASARDRSLRPPPPGSPHLARPPPAPPPERALPVPQPLPHVPQALHGSRPAAPGPANLPPRGRRRPPANGGAR